MHRSPEYIALGDIVFYLSMNLSRINKRIKAASIYLHIILK